MSNYKFYVYTNNSILNNLILKDTVAEYKNNNIKGYKIIGIIKDNIHSCDLLNNIGLNNDYKDKFKNDSLITVNTIGILKSEFNIAV